MPTSVSPQAVARWAPPAGTPARRLVVFPHSGAGGLSGRSLLASDVEVLTHRRPGRESRMADPAPADMDEVVQEAVAAMVPLLDQDDLPTDVIGHSFGAVVAAEFAAALERTRPGRLRRVVVSAKTPPPDSDPQLLSILHDDAALASWLGELGGTSQELLADPEMRAMILSPLRVDLSCSLTHDRTPPEVSTAMLVVSADADETAPAASVRPWERYSSGATEHLELHGGHHALFENTDRLHEILRSPVPGAPGASA